VRVWGVLDADGAPPRALFAEPGAAFTSLARVRAADDGGDAACVVLLAAGTSNAGLLLLRLRDVDGTLTLERASASVAPAERDAAADAA
jgi:hypothetical protein